MRIIKIHHQTRFEFLEQREAIAATTQVICAHQSLATALDVPYCSLEMLARQHCQHEGWQILSPWMAHQRRLAVIREQVQDQREDPTWPHLQHNGSSEGDLSALERRLIPGLTSLLWSDLDLAALAAITPHSSPLTLLLRVAQAYCDRLEHEKSVDPAQVYQRAARLQPTPRPLWVCGYPEWIDRQPRLQFLNAIAAPESLLVLPSFPELDLPGQQQAIAALQALGWTLETSEDEPSVSATATVSLPVHPQPATSYVNQEEEVRGVLRQVKRLLHQGVAPQEMALVTWDLEGYDPILQDIAWEYELPLTCDRPRPLLKTPLGAWLNQVVATVRSRFDFEPTAALLRHPLTPTAPQILGTIDWGKVRRQHPHTGQGWRDCGARLTALEGWRRGDRSTWIARLQELLESWQLKQRLLSHRSDRLAWSSLEQGLQHLAQANPQPLTLEQFTQELLDTLSWLRVTPEPSEGAIALHSPETLLGAKYGYLWVLGVADGMIPSPLPCDPLLDLYRRKQLRNQGFAIETALTLTQRQLLVFRELFRVAEQIYLSYPRQIKATPRSPSPYLARFEIPVQAADDQGAIASWQELRQRALRQGGLRQGGSHQPISREDPVLSHAARSWAIEQGRLQGQGGDRFQGLTDVPLDLPSRCFSASQLTHLGQCGFKWFAGDLLKIRELAEAETEFSARLRGKLYHKTLELATQKALETRSPDLRQALLQHLEAAFEEAEVLEQLPELAAWGARRKEHLQRLHRTISQGSFLADDSQILATERSFEGEWYGFRVRGQIDRLDLTPKGYVVIEYKSRSSRPTRAKNDQGKADLDVQLPLYQDLVGQQLQEENPTESASVQAYYYSLTKAKRLGTGDKVDRAALERFSDRLKTHLKQGDYPVEPDSQQSACQYCPHDVICRKS
ncbi:MAG: PD-(D/E)XK nuclease family protein [Phormidium sp.]